MKKVLFTIATVVGLSIVGYAQEQKVAGIKYYTPEVLDEIKATPEQKQKVAELVANYNASVKAIKKNNALSEEEQKAALRQASLDRGNAYWKVLTPEQTKYLKDKKKQLQVEK